MDFSGPEPADLADVRSLNVGFLECLRARTDEPLGLQMPASLRPAVAALTDRHVQRLAKVPFLLLTVRESDDAYWRRIFVDRPNRDLFTTTPVVADELSRIVSAALGFLWQLTRRNPYAARLVSGGSLNWCGQLAACTFLRVLRRAAEDQDLIGLRSAGDTDFWHRLLGAGLSSEQDVRRAAHLCALQTMLTSREATAGHRLRAAACYSSVPTLTVRERPK